MITLEEESFIKPFENVNNETMTQVHEYVKNIINTLRVNYKLGKDLTSIYDKEQMIRWQFDRIMRDKNESFNDIKSATNIQISYNYDDDKFYTYQSLNSSSVIKFNLDINGTSAISKIVREAVSSEEFDYELLDKINDRINKSTETKFKNKFAKDTKILLSNNNSTADFIRVLMKDASIRGTYGKMASLKLFISNLNYNTFKSYSEVHKCKSFAAYIIGSQKLSDSELEDIIDLSFKGISNNINVFYKYKYKDQLERLLLKNSDKIFIAGDSKREIARNKNRLISLEQVDLRPEFIDSLAEKYLEFINKNNLKDKLYSEIYPTYVFSDLKNKNEFTNRFINKVLEKDDLN